MKKGSFIGRVPTIEQWLEQRGELTTREIYNLFLDDHPKKCPTINELASMLAYYPEFEKKSTKGKITTWGLKEVVV